MIFRLEAGKKYRTRDGSEAEVFAERDGVFYGMVKCKIDLSAHTFERMGDMYHPEAIAWGQYGNIVQPSYTGNMVSNWDILPPAPVKKWRWVMKDDLGKLYETAMHFKSAAHAEECCRMIANSNDKAIARIEGSEVEE